MTNFQEASREQLERWEESGLIGSKGKQRLQAMRDSDSLNIKFKVWRSKQSPFLNRVIDTALGIKDLIVLLLIWMAFFGAIALITLIIIHFSS